MGLCQAPNRRQINESIQGVHGKEFEGEQAYSMVEQDKVGLLAQSRQQGINALNKFILHAGLAQCLLPEIVGRQKSVSRLRGRHDRLEKRLTRCYADLTAMIRTGDV